MTHICVENFPSSYFQNKRVTAKDVSIIPEKNQAFHLICLFASSLLQTQMPKREFKGKRGTEKSIHVTFTDVLKVMSKLCMWELKSCKIKPQ